MNLNAAMILVNKFIDVNVADFDKDLTKGLAELMVEVYNQGVEDGKGYVRTALSYSDPSMRPTLTALDKGS
jgi:hypothetical protein